MDLKIIDSQLQTKIYRFIEGDKEIPIENASDIFKKELSLLRSLESFAGGIESFFWSIERSKQSQKKSDNLSWLYYDRSIR